MGLFSKKMKSEGSALTVQTARREGHPFSELGRYIPLASERRLYKTLREAIPIIDAAIYKIIRLMGGFEVVCKDKRAQEEMKSFLKTVQVGAYQTGIQSFLSAYLEQLMTYGNAVGEIVPEPGGSGIRALYNAPLDALEVRQGDNPLQLDFYHRGVGDYQPLAYPSLILFSALNPEPGQAEGVSLLRGLPFVSGILLKIYNTIGVNWERVGNVRFAVTYKPTGETGERGYTKERAEQMAREWSSAMREDSGTVSDFVAVGDVGIQVIGADNQILDSNIPVRQMLEQIVAKLGIPPFLLGLSWSSTERMSSGQADILTSELEAYRRILEPVIEKICSMWLRMQGYGDRVDVAWENINLQDEVELANARLRAAQAAEIEERTIAARETKQEEVKE